MSIVVAVVIGGFVILMLFLVCGCFLCTFCALLCFVFSQGVVRNRSQE